MSLAQPWLPLQSFGPLSSGTCTQLGVGVGWASAPTSSICLDGLHCHQQLSWTVWSFPQRAVVHLPILQMRKLRPREGQGLSQVTVSKETQAQAKLETRSSVPAPRHWGPQTPQNAQWETPDLNIFHRGVKGPSAPPLCPLRQSVCGTEAGCWVRPPPWRPSSHCGKRK